MLDSSDYATKADLTQLRGELRAEMQDLRSEMRLEMQELRGEMRVGFAELRTEIMRSNAELRGVLSDHQRRVFGAMMGQYALIIGLYGLIISRLH